VVALRAYRKAVADLNPAAVFHRLDPMNYQAFTNDSLTMMYEGIRGALGADNALSGLGEEPRFRVREAARRRTGDGNAQPWNVLRRHRLVRGSMTVGLSPRSRARRFHPGVFCCRARRSAGFPAPDFEVRPIRIPAAGKIERPTAVHTVFERPAG
jgi:hypothetical protein